jgi:hypothetical protein
VKLALRYKYGIIALQLFLLVGSSLLLYNKLSDQALWPQLHHAFQVLNSFHYLLIIALSVCFWLLDTQLWRTVLKPFVQINFPSALRYNVIAQSAGVLTPFLVGDYGLRSYFLRDELEARQNTLVTLAYQLVKVATRISIGLVALIFISFQTNWRFTAIILAVALLLAGAMTIQHLVKIIAHSKLARRFLGDRDRLDFGAMRLKVTTIPATLLFSTFCLQTALLIHWIDPQTPFLEVLAWVIVTYSLTSFLPPMSIFDPLVKSAFGTLLYVQVAGADVLLFAFTSTWVVNRGIPALLSGVFFRRMAGLSQPTSNSTS